MIACEKGHLEIIKYLLDNPFVSCKSLILEKDNVTFIKHN